MPSKDEYKIVVKKDSVELKKLEQELKAQRQKELEAVKTSNKIMIEEEKRKTKAIEQQYKIELEQFKATQKEKERLIREASKVELEEKRILRQEQAKIEKLALNEKRKLAQEQAKIDKQPKYAAGSLGDLKREASIIKSQLTSGLSLKGVKLSTQELEQLKQKFIQLNPAIKKATREMNQMGVKSKRSIHQILETAENLTTVLYGVGFAFSKIVDKGKDIVMTAARTETLGVVVQQVGKNAGYTSGEIDRYVQGVKEMGITTGASRQSITRMIQAQLDLKNATKLARISQDAAVIGNMNSSEAMEQLVYGIQTHNKIVLKTMGLVIDIEGSYKEYAKTLGITASQLDEDQKTQAVLNAVLERGVDIAGSYEASMETAGKKIKSFERYTEEAKNELGGAFLPVVNKGIDAVTSLTKTFTESEKPVQIFAGGIFLLGSNITTLLPLVASLKIAFGGSFVAAMGVAGGAIAGIGAAAVSIYNTISQLISMIDKVIVKGQQMSLMDVGRTMSKTTLLTNWLFPDEDKSGSGNIWKKGDNIWKVQDKLMGLTKQQTEEYKKQTEEKRKQKNLEKEIKDKTGGTPRGGQTDKVDEKELEAQRELQRILELNKIIWDNLPNSINQTNDALQTLITSAKDYHLIFETTVELMTYEEMRLASLQAMWEAYWENQREGASQWKDVWNNTIQAVGSGMSGLFAGFVSETQTAGDAMKTFLKNVVNTFITSVQAMVIAAAAAAGAKGITSFGLTMITDAPLLAAAWLSLEAAKGVISGLAKGGTAEAGTPYIVGEKGQELFIPNQSGQVLSNKDTMKLLTGIGGSNPIVNNYFSVESDFISVMEKNMPLYNQRKYAKR